MYANSQLTFVGESVYLVNYFSLWKNPTLDFLEIELLYSVHTRTILHTRLAVPFWFCSQIRQIYISFATINKWIRICHCFLCSFLFFHSDLRILKYHCTIMDCTKSTSSNINVAAALTNPYPLDLRVALSYITTASSISPNVRKKSLKVSSVVW